MNIIWHRAGLINLDLLTETRITVLRAANGLDEQADLEEVRQNSRVYYQGALADGSHVAWLAFDGDSGQVAAAGGISFFRVMPTVSNPTGEKAYIMNMYTAPGYRRRGLATHMLKLLTEEAAKRGVVSVSLEATDAGRPLYERFGFVTMEHEMELPFR